MEEKITVKVLIMKVSISMESQTEKEFLYGQMEKESMMDIGDMESFMGKEERKQKTEQYMMASGEMAFLMAKVIWNGQMEADTMDNGETANLMVKEQNIILMAVNIKGNG